MLHFVLFLATEAGRRANESIQLVQDQEVQETSASLIAVAQEETRTLTEPTGTSALDKSEQAMTKSNQTLAMLNQERDVSRSFITFIPYIKIK